MNNSILLSFDHLLKIQDIGSYSINRRFTHPNRRLDWNVFLYVADGQMEVWEEEKEYVIKKGEYLFLKSGLHHWGEPKTLAGTSWYWIHFYNNLTNNTCEPLNPYSGTYQTPSISPEEYQKYIILPKQGTILHSHGLKKKLDFMLETFQSAGPFRVILLSMQTMELFLSVFKESTIKSLSTRSDYTVQQVIAFLEQRDCYELSSREVEASLNMNYSYLCEVFKRKTGSTIHRYNSQIFINKAVGMMRNSNRNITEISDLLGFKNTFYFSRVFKKIMGCAPSEYRNRIYRDIT